MARTKSNKKPPERVMVLMTSEMLDKLKADADKHGDSVSGTIRHIIVSHYEKRAS